MDDRDGYLASETFVESDAIRRALDDDVPFVCGRKGTGKTAVAIKLAESRRFSQPVQLEEAEYRQLHTQVVTELHNNPTTAGVTPDDIEDLFYQIWTLLLTLSVIDACTYCKASSKQDEEYFEKLRDRWAEMNPKKAGPIAVTARYIRNVLKRYFERPAALTGISEQLRSVMAEENVRELIRLARIVCEGARILVTIDTLEQYDQTPQRIRPLRGMCRAILDFYTRRDYPGVAIKCFLPAELIDEVFAANKFKYMDMAVVLDWGYSDLIEFIGRRYSRYLRASGSRYQELGKRIQRSIDALSAENDRSNSAWRDDVWKLFAPLSIRNRLGQQEDGPTYFLRHTQRRPRECLSAMNHIVELAARTAEFPALSADVICRAIHRRTHLDAILNSSLSLYRFGELRVPLQEIVGRVFANETVLFSKRHLREMTARVVSEFDGYSRAAVHELLESLLVRTGLVGAVREERPNIGPSRLKYYVTEFEYGMPGRVSLNEASRCAVHPILGDFLGLRDRSESPGVILPYAETESLETDEE